MKKSSKVESKEHVALIQQYNNLEKQWKSLEKPKPRNPRSSGTSFYHSPRNLMYSLQQSPSDRDKPLNTAVEEILSDRRAALMTGKLKGRRLFQAAEEEYSDGGGGEVSNDWLDNDGTVVYNQCYTGSDSSPLVVEEKERGGDWRRSGGGFVATVALFGVVLLLVSIVLVSMSCDGKYVQKNGLINLVPT